MIIIEITVAISVNVQCKCSSLHSALSWGAFKVKVLLLASLINLLLMN